MSKDDKENSNFKICNDYLADVFTRDKFQIKTDLKTIGAINKLGLSVRYHIWSYDSAKYIIITLYLEDN